jgi:RNA polymerase sigma-70 factor, ECF subfamily
MNEQQRQDLFSELMARHQSELYGYIFAVVRNWPDADDLFQSVCLVLWTKFDTFRPGSSFFAWGRQVAKIKISDFLRHRRSSNHVGEKLMDTITAISADVQQDDAEPFLAALERCRGKLSAKDDHLLNLRYVEELGTREIADRMQRLQPNVCRSLNRIRRWLLECIQRELARQQHSDEGIHE